MMLTTKRGVVHDETCKEKGSTRHWHYLEDYWSSASGLAAVNAILIGTHLRDVINDNLELTRHKYIYGRCHGKRAECIHTYIHTCMTRMTGPDCAVIICNLINIHTYIHVCVFVFFPFILDIKFVGRTSRGRGHTRGRSHRFSHPPSFCGACLTFSREKGSAISFPRRL